VSKSAEEKHKNTKKGGRERRKRKGKMGDDVKTSRPRPNRVTLSNG